MKMKWKIAVVAVLALALIAGSAMAMPIVCTEGTVALKGTKGDSGKTVKTNLQSFQLLGRDASGNYLVFGNESYYSITPQNMSGVLAQIDPEALQTLVDLASLTPLSRGAKGDEVVELQKALVASGRLKGAADGDFGAGTERAVSALQAEFGLEENGIADEKLQMLALSLAQPEIEISETSSAAELYDTITERSDTDLQSILDSGMLLTYDDMTGIGFITNGNTLTYNASGDTDLDLYELTLQFGLSVRDGDDGSMELTPAVQVSCRCVRRPVLTEIIVKSGSQRGASEISDLTVTLDGSYSVEKGTALLTDQMVAALAGAKDAGELKVRVNGRYNSFDFQADSLALNAIADVGQVAQSLQK